MKENIILNKSYSFALEIIKVYQYLSSDKSDKKEFILSKQLLRSGTAIGALIREAEHAQSTKDFLHKMNISLKEANETLYWLQLLKDSGILDISIYHSIFPKSEELVRLLVSIVKTLKGQSDN
ncbi:four helix bundle protein [Chryseobacterium indologenes]|uniref:Four helix bundle protein n=2 Tax=Chryseobacterium indologenes TaxID=253 RepID=A0AAD1DU24_CHRID|nr:four helix bundle protein [Chryseobacterium indologenes]ASE61230.1 four helix bundle protein [Chryseobacterium indologenes]AZB16901.1 four helix bundle protein [Chryseobacterium indologenes]